MTKLGRAVTARHKVPGQSPALFLSPPFFPFQSREGAVEPPPYPHSPLSLRGAQRRGNLVR